MHVIKQVGLDWRGNVPGWHSAKHGVGPQGLLSRAFAVVHDLFRHAFIHLNIMLFEPFAFKDGGTINQSDDRKKQDAANNAERFFVLLKECFFHQDE